jgi:outer membrane protein OmpA-like peptidoglycan-associated protein
MKKWINLLVFLLVGFSASSQEKNPDKKGHAIGFHFTLHDFQTGQDLKNLGLSEVLNKGEWNEIKHMSPGFALSYLKGMTDNIDFMGRLGFASLVDMPIKSRQGRGDGLTHPLVESDVNLNFKLTSDKYWVSPYISLGAGASTWNGYWAAYFPAGLGLQVNFYDKAYLILQSQYRLPLTSNNANHLFYSLGFAATIGKKKELPPPLPPPPADTDGDGITDPQDACPTVAGIAAFQGCPDTDNDGIKDSDDKCPTVPGVARYEGCPIPDTDGDGINDEADKCPTIAGIARYNGCPIPDTDGDGVNDEEDRCPDVPGVVENRGCPKIDFQAHEVTFQSGKSILLIQGKKELDVLVDVLQKNPTVRVSLEGHTDNTGTDKINDPLSVKRAEAAKAYLVSKGIEESRLETSGFGSKSPVADNKTAQGRKLNRRVEVKVL